MTATPAWPPDSAPRLFVDQLLGEGVEVALESGQANYLLNVMRLKPGDAVRCFDDRTGEWAAEIASAGKRDARLRMVAPLGPREAVPDLWLLAAPIKRQRIDWLAEKACELGVDRLVPVLTRRTVVDRLNPERLRAHMIEAAEQCGRTALPALAEPVKLAALLADWPENRTLFFADETGGLPFHDAAAAQPGPAAILIGPEGGFDPAERDAIRALPQAVGIALGPRILRAETAALAAVSLWMAAAGDWKG
jgi:16S rRNA (uracil1498-N3)-methyltransferase